MAYYMTPIGTVIYYPWIADRAFLEISPLTFVHKLMVANPNLPVKMLTSENIKYTFVSTLFYCWIVYVGLSEEPVSGVRPIHQVVPAI